ncbi:MerR family transcriptional regulator [Enterococcus mundtii]|uniref:helix-turn-helix domain-containing protein n=1 Tax=Enterococcus mundtii TaxID=53346 RepID=UPI000A353578|nr:MerR family transcriptional regulator [Enterococcus mundtii]
MANLFNIEPSTIRFWEKKQLISLSRDEENNYRYFDAHSILQLVDITFFRNLEIPITDLILHLNGDLDQRNQILNNTLVTVDNWIKQLNAVSKVLNTRIREIAHINDCLDGKKNLNLRFPFSKFEPLDLYKKEHVSSLLNNPTNFLLLFTGDHFDTITEEIGIIDIPDNTIPKDHIEESRELYFGGVLTVDRYDYNENNLNKLLKSIQDSANYSSVIAQYIIGGLENNRPIDYYFFWLM